MNKKIIIAVLATIIIGASAFYYIAPKLINSYAVFKIRSQNTQDIATFFKYAKEETLNGLMHEIEEKAKKETPINPMSAADIQEEIEATKTTIAIFDIIAERNIEALKQISTEQLEEGFRIFVPAAYFNDDMGGTLVSRYIQGGNAIAAVLFHSALDRTSQDKEKTLAMLRVLFDKKLDPNTQARELYWVKDSPSDDRALDYVQTMSLPELAEKYSFDDAQKLLQEYIKTFKS